MNLDKLTQCSGEWLRGTGPESDIVISSRVRLARNLAAYPFTNRAGPGQKAEIEGVLRARIDKLEVQPKLYYYNVPTLSTLDRQLLVERQLISRELASSEGPRGVALRTGNRQRDGQRGGPSPLAGHALRIFPG